MHVPIGNGSFGQACCEEPQLSTTQPNVQNHLDRKSVRGVIFSALLGTSFEWYDFFLYTSLVVFFSGLFFPKGNPTAALLSSFATYGVAFLVRPFGALLFGHLGDVAGRKYTFLLTIVLMGGATTAIGLLPPFLELLPRTAIAYTGTYVVGHSARYYYRFGNKPPPEIARELRQEAQRLAEATLARLPRR